MPITLGARLLQLPDWFPQIFHGETPQVADEIQLKICLASHWPSARIDSVEVHPEV